MTRRLPILAALVLAAAAVGAFGGLWWSAWRYLDGAPLDPSPYDADPERPLP